MKKLLILLALGISVSLANAQKMQSSEVPAPIKNAFQKLYPEATNVKWEKEQANYEASFDMNKVDQSALFDPQGNLIETEVEIELGQLPKGIIEYVKSNYAGKQVKEAERITDVRGEIVYEAEINGMDLIFDAAGHFIKEVKK